MAILRVLSHPQPRLGERGVDLLTAEGLGQHQVGAQRDLESGGVEVVDGARYDQLKGEPRR